MNGNGNGTDVRSGGSSSERPVGRTEVMAAVLDAATELFAERGPDAVTVRDVADRAGVNHALIHRHYGTKQELLRVVLAQAIERMNAVSQGVTDTHGDVRRIVAATRDLEPTVRLVAWSILAGYPIEEIWPEHPALERLRSVLETEHAATAPRPDLADPRIALATATSMLLGWIVFAPFIDRATGVRALPGFDEDAMLNDAAQALLGRAR